MANIFSSMTILLSVCIKSDFVWISGGKNVNRTQTQSNSILHEISIFFNENLKIHNLSLKLSTTYPQIVDKIMLIEKNRKRRSVLS